MAAHIWVKNGHDGLDGNALKCSRCLMVVLATSVRKADQYVGRCKR